NSKKKTKKTNVIFGKNRDTISYQEVKIKNDSDGKPLERVLKDSLKMINLNSNVNLIVEDNKVYIYPFRYTRDTVNNFFKENDVFLELKERKNYSFKYRTYQFGVVTIPVKWYVNSKLGNITTDINAMISGGYKWGKTHIVKLPHEEKARQYQRTWSINAFVGISKLTFDESNTVKDNPVKGNVAAISTGLAFGVHYQDFTFLVASGYDFPTSNRKNWEFNKIPWIGFGFGYNFIKTIKPSND